MNRPTATPRSDRRLQAARQWLAASGVELSSAFVPIAGDASFRRYFRVTADGRSRVLMDAAPPAEDVGPFCDISRRLIDAGLKAPNILHADRKLGFLLLEDLGNTLYRDLLTKQTAGVHFEPLFDVLRDMAVEVDCRGLPSYDAALLQAELDLFPDWYLGRHRPRLPRDRFDGVWEPVCRHLLDAALAQPRCFVHRDFHSCNLLRTPGGQVGIIDFQDAVAGPLSYDLVSLLWDRYISWPREQLRGWIEAFRDRLGLDLPPADWQRCCDLMALQRNIKVVGIFARLHYRDGKRGYLEMIPRFYAYLLETLRHYPEFDDFRKLLERETCAP